MPAPTAVARRTRRLVPAPINRRRRGSPEARMRTTHGKQRPRAQARRGERRYFSTSAAGKHSAAVAGPGGPLRISAPGAGARRGAFPPGRPRGESRGPLSPPRCLPPRTSGTAGPRTRRAAGRPLSNGRRRWRQRRHRERVVHGRSRPCSAECLSVGVALHPAGAAAAPGARRSLGRS